MPADDQPGAWCIPIGEETYLGSFDGMREIRREMELQLLHDMQQMWVDMRDGPRLGPGRAELWRIMQPVWKRRWLKQRLDRMGRPAGSFRRREKSERTGANGADHA